MKLQIALFNLLYVKEIRLSKKKLNVLNHSEEIPILLKRNGVQLQLRAAIV